MGARPTSAACTPCLIRGTRCLHQQSGARREPHVAPAHARCCHCRSRTPRWPRVGRAAAHCASACRRPQTPHAPPAGLRSSARTSHGGRGPAGSATSPCCWAPCTKCGVTRRRQVKRTHLRRTCTSWRRKGCKEVCAALQADHGYLLLHDLSHLVRKVGGRRHGALLPGLQRAAGAVRRCAELLAPVTPGSVYRIRAEANQTTWDCCTPRPALEHQPPVGQGLCCRKRPRRSISRGQAGE